MKRASRVPFSPVGNIPCTAVVYNTAMNSTTAREYELVLLGATGYTGKLCAEYITNRVPTDIRWAIAGRSSSKLTDLCQLLKSCDPDRPEPSTLPCIVAWLGGSQNRQTSKSLH